MSRKIQSCTEKELNKKIENVEQEIKSIFEKDYIPLFLVNRAKRLFTKWKLLTNWKEDDTPPHESTLKK